jgi:hypothetical protein
MILLEEHIALIIIHKKALLKFEVLQTLRDNDNLSFSISYLKEYVYTLVTKSHCDFVKLELSPQDVNAGLIPDPDIYSKIVIALYALFFNEQHS